MNEILEPNQAWILEKTKKEIQRRLEKARPIRNKYFQKEEIEAFYFWEGYVAALYEVLVLVKELEGGIKNEWITGYFRR